MKTDQPIVSLASPLGFPGGDVPVIMPTMHEKFMKLALAEAKAAQARGDMPFGAVIVKGGEVVAVGESKEKTNCTVTDHAETGAVRIACRKFKTLDLSDCTIYCSGEPCNMCASAIFQAKIPTVVIGASRSDLPHFFRQRRIGIDDLAADCAYGIEVVRGVLKDDCIALFDEFKS